MGKGRKWKVTPFARAGTFVMPFGKYRGKSIDRIARTDDGLLYLDWLIGEQIPTGYAKWAIETYLADPTIKEELEKIVENRLEHHPSEDLGTSEGHEEGGGK